MFGINDGDDESDPLRSARGYNFRGVTRWFAERADVILLFFDPDKPGTTGETLEVLTRSLSGLDHKLHIVLNKADQFYRVNDFARAYGSLCWNLSKVRYIDSQRSSRFPIGWLTLACRVVVCRLSPGRICPASTQCAFLSMMPINPSKEETAWDSRGKILTSPGKR